MAIGNFDYNIDSLTTLEMRILTALCEPQTSSELFENLSIGYPYGIKVVRRLKAKKLIDEQKRGNQNYYFTIRTTLTESLFLARAKTTGKSTYLFPYRGEHCSILEVGRKLQSTKSPLDLLELTNRIVLNLQYNSYRKEQNQPTQRPYSDHMRKALELRLAKARLEILFAEELLKAPVWNDSPKDWRTIGAEIPDMEKGKANSDVLEQRIYKKS